ncbi:MAG: C10 family peptidase [Bacteroidales bacterium]|nr:C10 family peptidase [Bacteroidales bacterium]
MKYLRHFLTALLCIFFTVNALAADVTKNNATKVAKNYFSEALFSDESNREVAVLEVFDIKKDGKTTLYVFNFEGGGYVIVSADDRFTPILGYSPNGYYETGNMPGGFEYLMDEFSEMIVFIREQNIAAEQKYTEKWERYTSDNPILERGITAEIVVHPLTALWNQDFPYNYYCPLVNGSRTYAGCVATAMSMIMYYWRWPLQGTGSKTYRPYPCKGTQMPILTANFGETHYDYNGMFGTATIKSDDRLYEPLSLLQYHVGISVSMGYCTDGSGANSGTVPTAMKNYFKYDPSIEYVQRKDYADTEAWTAMMKDQLELKQPVYVSGHPPTGDGHAFVCDGYRDDDMFHYNFGWSGSANGYFVADKPSSFTLGVGAVINFIPDRSQGYPHDNNVNWIVPHMKGMLADCSGPMDNYAAGTKASWLIDPTTFGDAVDNITISHVEMDLAEGDYLRFYEGDNDSAPPLREFTGTAKFDPFSTTSGKVLVTLTAAPASPTGKGFMIIYEAKPTKYCTSDITLTTASGTFTDGSPEELNYPNSTSCRWYIFPDNATLETEFVFNFTRLDTEEGADLIKFYDYGNNILMPVATISGSPDELPQVSIKTNQVMVTFVSNSNINGKGFEITYNTGKENIKEVENINDFSVYPNPASNKLNVKFNTSTTDNFDIVIYNVTGQAVYKESLNNFLGSYHNELNIADFAQGVYLMHIKSSKGAVTHKVVIQ